jgi:D-3-phosphoglycerate dehydrogenase
MSEPVVVITDHPWPSVDIERDVLANAGIRLVDADGVSERELLAYVADAEGIMTCFAPVTQAVIDAAPRLRVIGRIGVGVDNIDVAAATARSIPVTNVPAYCIDEVAEHTLALLLSLRRRLADHDRRLRSGHWGLDPARPLHRLAGQTLGVLGLGRIGTAVARAAQGFDMQIIACTEFPGAEALARIGIEAVTLSELASRADVVSIHLPLTDQTRGIVNAEFLAAMKPDAMLINVARGEIVDHDALVTALAAGTIGGAGLDVFAQEPLADDDPLLGSPNTVLTPHVAFYSEESLRDLARLASENVAAVLRDLPPASIVNLPHV